MLVIMSTTHRCVSQEHRTASFSYGYDIPQGLHQHHRVHTQQVKVDDLFLKITVVVPQLVHIERTKLMLFGSRNPIYLNMSFCGVLLVGFFFLLFAGGYCSYVLSQCLEAAYLLPCTSHCYSNQCSVELCVLTVRSVLTLGLSPCRCCWHSEEDSVLHRSLQLAALHLAVCTFQGTVSGLLTV